MLMAPGQNSVQLSVVFGRRENSPRKTPVWKLGTWGARLPISSHVPVPGFHLFLRARTATTTSLLTMMNTGPASGYRDSPQTARGIPLSSNPTMIFAPPPRERAGAFKCPLIRTAARRSPPGRRLRLKRRHHRPAMRRVLAPSHLPRARRARGRAAHLTSLVAESPARSRPPRRTVPGYGAGSGADQVVCQRVADSSARVVSIIPESNVRHLMLSFEVVDARPS